MAEDTTSKSDDIATIQKVVPLPKKYILPAEPKKAAPPTEKLIAPTQLASTDELRKIVNRYDIDSPDYGGKLVPNTDEELRDYGMYEKAAIDRVNKKKAQDAGVLPKTQKVSKADQRRQAQGIAETARLSLKNAGDTVQPAIDRVGAMSTVGGIGLLVAIIVFLLFVLVQVNGEGDTRLKQIWYMLNGRATLQGSVVPTGTVPGGTTPTTPTTPTVPVVPPTIMSYRQPPIVSL